MNIDTATRTTYDSPITMNRKIQFELGPRPHRGHLSARNSLLAAAFALVSVATGFAQTVSGGAAVFSIPTADPTRYLENVKTLASPNMEGRGAGTKGIERAAKLIEDQYKTLGIQPAGTNGYRQPFTVVTGAKLAGHNELHEQIANTKKDLKLNNDFVPFSFSSSGQVSASVVFAGYGASATEFGYDDYAGIDVKDKIVVLLRYEPTSFGTKSGNQGLTTHAAMITKAINARNHGAKAVIVVNGKLGDNEEDLLTRFGSVSGPENVGVILVQAKNNVAQEWFAAAGKSLADIQKQINDGGTPASFAFPDTVHLDIRVNIETLHATVNNILAYLPGQTDEYIIIGAHYDHLGYGNQDSLAPSQIGQIHPGADDNASGTAGVLEIARLFAPLSGKLRRGILFMDFAGEELGLLGSAEWVKEPTRPLAEAITMINMDMIGRINGDKVYVGGIGTGSTFQQLFDSNAKGLNFNFEYSKGGYAASDHTSFVAKKIPVLFFFSGLHSDYHKPSDTWEKINAPDAARLLNWVMFVAMNIIQESPKPEFVTVIEDANPHAGVVSGSGGGGYGPWFGSIPDFGESPDGVRFSDIQPGSPAAKSGFKAGDILTKFGDMPIKNLYDFTDALRRSTIGQTVEVTVLRNGMPVTAQVKLEQRR